MFFKITLPKDPDMLPVYTQADNPTRARQRVERLLGPLKDAKVVEVKQSEIPEGETIL